MQLPALLGRSHFVRLLNSQLLRPIERLTVAQKEPATAGDFDERRADIFDPREFNASRRIIRKDFDYVTRPNHSNWKRVP
jgi:hypothetical protein